MAALKTMIPFLDEWLAFQNEDRLMDHVREEIKQDWQDSKSAGINGFEHPRIIFLSEDQIQVVTDKSSHLIKVVNRRINQLVTQLDNECCIPIYLFNDEGILLQIFGGQPDQFLDRTIVKPGLLAGFPFLANTALSLAIKTKRAQVVRGAEHYFSAFHAITTLAVPIFHPIHRDCIGILTTGIRNSEPIQPHHSFLISLAMMIEECIRMEYSHANIFRIHEETTNLIDYYISVISSDGRIVDCNSALRDLLPHYELVGMLGIDLIKDFDHDYLSSPMYRAIYDGEETSNYEFWTKVNGQRRCYLTDTKIIYDPFDSEFYWIIHVCKDITEKKEMELNVVQREKLVSLGTLAAGLAHEIRNPLTTAKGFIQLLSENVENKDAFMLVQNELNRIAQLVNQFVLLSKPDFPMMKWISVRELLEGFVSFIQPEALLKGIEVQTQICHKETLVNVDRNQMTQVFINLAQNAFAAMKTYGKLLIECHCADVEYIEIRFIDNGIGISEEDLIKILDPFFTTHEEGTGLGLPICYQIIEAHHGELKIESEPDHGTTVTIRLPKEIEIADK